MLQLFYYNRKCTWKLLNSRYFCNISPSYDHSPEAIWAHLQPILNQLQKIAPEVENIDFFSNRQKKKCFLFNKYIAEDDNLKFGSWSFFEAGHGKGAADGIGGAIKRAADLLVAQGVDLSDAKTLFTNLKGITSIQLHYISEDDVELFKKVVPSTLPVLKGTIQVHQIFSEGKDTITYRDVSCFCRLSNICKCYQVKYFCILQENKNLLKKTIQDPSKTIHNLTDSLKHGKSGIQKNSFVLVKLTGKKTVKYYVAEIVNVEGTYFTIKYLKKVTNHMKFFRGDDKEYEIEIDDNEMKLLNPIMAGGSVRQLQ